MTRCHDDTLHVGARRALRRAVRMPCELLSDLWDEPVAHVLRDLSPLGAFVDSPLPLETGDALLVSVPAVAQGLNTMRVEHQGLGRDLVLSARVVRSSLGRRRGEMGRSGMGLAFEASETERLALMRILWGFPPPLPRRGAPRFIDVPVILEERLDDRTNILEEVALLAVAEDALEEALTDYEPSTFCAIGPLLTGGSVPRTISRPRCTRRRLAGTRSCGRGRRVVRASSQ
jgi:hypothetical protein